MASFKRAEVRVVLGLAILLAAAFELRGTAQQPGRGRPLAIEDYYRIQTVGSPSISPNGRWVVFTFHLTVPKTAENPYGTAWTYVHAKPPLRSP